MLRTLITATLVAIVGAWPDGSPCIKPAYESMNPLEAVEHQGGLMMTPPPFYIEVDRKCYWKNQPIGVALKGNSSSDHYMGFAIQPYIVKGPRTGQRIGQFLRLDDNGSWQFQCFTKKDSVTHSHDEKKSNIKLWWKNDDDDTQYIQFVATVVVHLKQFWVKSVLSPPIAPCRIENQVTDWARPVMTTPPPAKQFKMDTWRIFNHESSGTFPRSISGFSSGKDEIRVRTLQPIPTLRTTTPQTTTLTTPKTTIVVVTRPPPTTTTPEPVRTTQPATVAPVTSAPLPVPPRPQPRDENSRRLTHIIPLPNMETNSKRKNVGRTVAGQVTPAPEQVDEETQARARLQTIRRRIEQQQKQQQQLIRQQQQQQQPVQQVQQRRVPLCLDTDPLRQCRGWIPYCGRSAYMTRFCPRTCGFC